MRRGALGNFFISMAGFLISMGRMISVKSAPSSGACGLCRSPHGPAKA
jgi:hypothetical protein